MARGEDGEDGGGHRGLQEDDALQLDGARQELREREEEHRNDTQSQHARHSHHTPALLGMKLAEVVRNHRADEHEAHRDGADAEHVRSGLHELRHVGRAAGEVQRQRQHDGEERRVEDFLPERLVGRVREDDRAQQPEGDFRPEVVDDEHADGLAVKERHRQWQRHVAVVVEAGAERERAPRRVTFEARQTQREPRSPDAQRDGGEADQRWKEEVFRAVQRRVVQHLVEDERRDQQVDGDAQQRVVGLGGEPLELAHRHARDGDEQHGQDGRKDNGEFVQGW